MRLIMIGRIYLLKSSEAERCILPDDAHQKPPARADCAKTAPKSNSAQSEHLAGQQEYHAYISVLLRKGAFKVFRFQSAPRRRPLAFAHAQNALFHLPVSKTPLQACMHPKRLSCSPEPKATPCDYLHPGRSFALAEPKATLCVVLYPNRPLELACAQSPFMPSRVQSSTSRLLESKAPLHDYSHPKPLMSSRVQRSPSCPPESKAPLVFAQILTRI